MSGGHFNYQQYSIHDMATGIRELLDSMDDIRPETRKRFEEAITALRLAETYVQRIDWFVSGDDGEDSFHARLKKDIAALASE